LGCGSIAQVTAKWAVDGGVLLLSFLLQKKMVVFLGPKEANLAKFTLGEGHPR
jgi:hypothetical protein